MFSMPSRMNVLVLSPKPAANDAIKGNTVSATKGETLLLKIATRSAMSPQPAARRLRLIVARRCETLDVDQHRLRGDVGRLRALDARRRRQDGRARRGEDDQDAGEAQRELARDARIGENHGMGSSGSDADMPVPGARAMRRHVWKRKEVRRFLGAAVSLAKAGYVDVNEPRFSATPPGPRR